jgi:predicted P-loop ATPase
MEEEKEKKKRKKSAKDDDEKEHKKNWREVYATVEDIKTFLSDHIYLRHNVITGRIECRVPTKDLWELGTDPFEAAQVDKWQPISDRIVNSLWTAMSRDKPVRAQDLFRVIESDFVPDYHPFRYYLENLPEWDGETDYILGMSVSVQVKGDVEEQILFANYLKKWLVGMVAAWIDPNVVNNVILVLIGEQGSYKTTWFNYLLPPELKDYFYTKTNANRMGRDDLLTLAQYALVCCEELDTMKPAELNQLKAAVTMPSIDERAAYAHFHEHRQHIASFCGTGNNVQFLSDETGNRRWLPFEIERITSPREVPFDYQGIYSQAYALYQEGFQYWFSREEIQRLSQHNATFETPHTAHELISRYLRKPKPGEPSDFLSATDILQLVGSNPVLKLTTNKIGRAMTDLGFERMRTGSERGYNVVQYSAEEIKARQRMKACDAKPETAGEDDANDTNDAFF